MITKDQLTACRADGFCDGIAREFHYTGRHECTRTVGPRGGVTVNITSVRRSGETQTWKRDAARFRVPVKYGLYESFEITEQTASDFHLPEDCPIR